MRSLYLDRKLPGIGRLKRAIDSDDPVLLRVYNAMVTLLVDEARLDILRGLRDGRLSFREVRELVGRYAPGAEAKLRGIEEQAGRARDLRLYAVLRRDTGEVKLGITDRVDKRMKALQNACAVRLEVLATWPGTRADERAMHRRFAQDRLLGEWFRYTLEIAQWVEERHRPTKGPRDEQQHGADALCTDAVTGGHY